MTTAPPSPHTVVIPPGGQGLIIDLVTWIIGRFSDLNLRISPEGLSFTGVFFRRVECKWAEIDDFGVASAMSPLPYDNSVSLVPAPRGSSLSRYAHYPSELLVTVLTAYKTASLLADPSATDEAIVTAAVRLTNEDGWHYLPRAICIWTVWAQVGHATPDLLPACIHTRAVTPLQEMITELGEEKAFSVLGSQDETSGPGRDLQIAGPALAWMAQNWKAYERPLRQALALCRAERTAKRGQYGKDGLCVNQTSGRAAIRGRPIDPAQLLESCPTLHSVQQAVGIPADEFIVFYDRYEPAIAQGVVWVGEGGGSLWLWMDKARLARNPRRGWKVDEVMEAPLSAVEYHDATAHVSRWKPHETNVSDRFFF